MKSKGVEEKVHCYDSLRFCTVVDTARAAPIVFHLPNVFASMMRLGPLNGLTLQSH